MVTLLNGKLNNYKVGGEHAYNLYLACKNEKIKKIYVTGEKIKKI